MIAVHLAALPAFGAMASCAIIAQIAAETEVLETLVSTTPSLSFEVYFERNPNI
jgi:hypothetical protein